MSRALTRTTARGLSATARTPLVILADHSLSMGDLVPELGVSAYVELKRALAIALQGRTDWTLYAFSDDVTRCEGPERIPPPDCSTYLAPALQMAQRHDPDALLVVTDGFPTDPTQALTAADLLGWTKIDVLFIGRDDPHAVDFCRRLARNGGQVLTSRQKMLEGITLLLGNGSIAP